MFNYDWSVMWYYCGSVSAVILPRQLQTFAKVPVCGKLLMVEKTAIRSGLSQLKCLRVTFILALERTQVKRCYLHICWIHDFKRCSSWLLLINRPNSLVLHSLDFLNSLLHSECAEQLKEQSRCLFPLSLFPECILHIFEVD